jgi:hypothetical protein
MRAAIRRVTSVIVALLLAAPALAQFGHPLKGSWTGDWSPSAGQTLHVLVEMKWDGKAISGTVNPGPHGVAISKATLDTVSWNVHLEADGKDAAGQTVHYVMDGKLENIGSSNRVVSGTWTDGATKGTLKLVRN